MMLRLYFALIITTKGATYVCTQHGMHDNAKRRQTNILKKKRLERKMCIYRQEHFIKFKKNPLKFIAIHFVAVGNTVFTTRMHLSMNCCCCCFTHECKNLAVRKKRNRMKCWKSTTKTALFTIPLILGNRMWMQKQKQKRMRMHCCFKMLNSFGFRILP